MSNKDKSKRIIAYEYLDRFISRGRSIQDNRKEVHEYLVNELGLGMNTARFYVSQYLTDNDLNKEVAKTIDIELFIGQKVLIEVVAGNGNKKDIFKGKISSILDRMIVIDIYKENENVYRETFFVADLIDNEKRKLKVKTNNGYEELNFKGVSNTNKFSFKELIKDDKAS